MPLHSKWTSGDLTFYDGTQDVFTIQDNDEGITIGEDEGGVDAKFFGGTASAYMLWDADVDDLLLVGGAGLVMDEGDITIGDTDYLIFGDGTDVSFTWSTGATLDVAVAAANTQIDWGTTGAPITHKFFGTSGTAAYMQWSSSGAELVFDLADISLGDTDYIKFGDDDDITMAWDANSFNIVGTSGNADVELGTANIPLRVKFFGTSGGSNYMQWDSSGSELVFSGSDISMADDDYVKFGADDDITLAWDGGSFNIVGTSGNAYVEFGTANIPLKAKFFGTSGGSASMIWDSSGSELIFEQADISMGDDDHLFFGDDPDVDIYFDGTDDLYIVPGTDLYNLKLGSSGGALSWDVYLYGGTSGKYLWFDAANDKLETVGIDIEIETNDHLYLGSSEDVDMYFNGANDFFIKPAADLDNLYLGSTGGDYSWDVIWTGTTGAKTVTFGGASDDVTFAGVDLVLGDDAELQLGDGSSGDWRLYFDSAQLMLEPVTAGDHADFYVGATGGSLSVDMTWFGDAGTNYVLFDSNNNVVEFEDVDIVLKDNAELRIGSTGTAGDIVIKWDATELNIVPAVDGTDVFFGSTDGDYSLDIKTFGTTGTAFMLWDSANDKLTFDKADISMGDTDFVKFGDDGDITLDWDGNFNIIGTSGNADILIGTANIPLRAKFFGTSGGSAYMQWDSSGSELIFDQSDISMGDTDYIKFGDSDEAIMCWTTGDVFEVVPGTDHADMSFGTTAGNKSWDLTIYGTDASHHVKWISTGDELDITGTLELQSTNKIQLGTTGSYIHASTGSQLDIVTTGTLYLNGEVTNPTPVTLNSTGDNQSLTAASVRTQFLTSTGNFNLLVPMSSGTGVAGIEFRIFNSTGGACSVCEGSTGTVIVAIGAGESAIVASNATEWRYLVGTS